MPSKASRAKTTTKPVIPPSAQAQTSAIQHRPSSQSSVFRDVLIIRLINAVCLGTFFQPDEFFQSLEPAWRLAFGPHSGAWMTWEWHHQLRSSIHPAIFSAMYVLTDVTSRWLPAGARTALLLIAPRILQGFFAALGDWFTWKLSARVHGSNGNVALFALLLQIASPWQWYVSTRTFSNSLETTLTVAALYYFPWNLFAPAVPIKENTKGLSPLDGTGHLRTSLALAALAVVLRPTNILIWMTIVFLAFTRLSLKGKSPITLSVALVLIREAVLTGSIVIAISAVSDRLYFGFWVFPPYKWLNFNISKSLAIFYGRNPWHYYLLQGLPLLCTTSLPFAVKGLVKTHDSNPRQSNILRTLSYTIITTCVALSLISHKEVRFIYPLLPILSVLSAPFAASSFSTPPSPVTPSTPRRVRNKGWLAAALSINAILAGYLSFLHQPAPLNVLGFLRKEYERIHPTSITTALSVPRAEHGEEELFALFLMPCHSTPWRSHLVYPSLRAYALTCEPPLHTEPNTPERETYRDEADRFYDDPLGFLTGELFAPGNVDLPRYIVGFEGIEPWLAEYMQSEQGKRKGLKSLKPVWSGFNGAFNEDWRRAGQMIVWDTGLDGQQQEASVF